MRPTKHMAPWLLALPLLLAAGRAEAQTADPVKSYALLVGSNPGGDGQGTLRFAERDAQRVADLLVEIGRVDAERTELLLSPERGEVMTALADLSRRLEQARARGEQSRLFFFYSGHARSNALNLGPEELPLDELREALMTLPTTLTVVVLDACQSGAFSTVKGAQPAADFTHNSVARLQTAGVAVMASSTGAELSQESEPLGSSYFTHHLLVALRGAGDRNRDGRVSLDEAYRYAYDHTLASTSRTAVGAQHVTLETELTGQGDVPLSFPAEASAQLALPAQLDGTILVQQAGGGSVMAELLKARGNAFSLALPPGNYEAVVRRGDTILSCPVTLNEQGRHVLSTEDCEEVDPPESQDKGQVKPFELWFAELGWGVRQTRETAFTDRLETFRFDGGDPIISEPHGSVTVGVNPHPNVGLYARYLGLGSGSFDRHLQGPNEGSPNDLFSWKTRSIALGVRGRTPLWKFVAAYGQLGIGLGFARSEIDIDDEITKERDFGPTVQAALGLQFRFFRYMGAFIEGSYVYAPVLDNLAGDTHDDGGIGFTSGLRFHTEGVW